LATLAAIGGNDALHHALDFKKLPVYPRHKPDKEKIEAEKDESIENKSRTEMLKWIKEDANGFEFYQKSGQYDPEFIPAYHVSSLYLYR